MKSSDRFERLFFSQFTVHVVFFTSRAHSLFLDCVQNLVNPGHTGRDKIEEILKRKHEEILVGIIVDNMLLLLDVFFAWCKNAPRKQQNFNQVSFLRIWLADNEFHSLIRTRLATNYNIIRVITLCSLLYVPGDARIQVETKRNCSEIQPHCFSTIREWIWRKYGYSQMADRPHIEKTHPTFIAAFKHLRTSLEISQSQLCSKGWSQLQVIFKAAQAMAPVRFRPSESSKATIHVPRALSPVKALRVSLGRVHEWQDAISVKSQRRSAHSEVPPSFNRMEVRVGAIKRKAKGCQLSNSALTETSMFAIW